jgi:predicted DNA binding CopG/RHH family protein
MKIDADEKEMLESVERGGWKSARGGKRERSRHSRYAKATFRKDRRLNILLSSKDLEAIQKRALAEGLPYQTLISSLLHKVRIGAAQRNLTRDNAVAAVQPTIVVDRRVQCRRSSLFAVACRSVNRNEPPADRKRDFGSNIVVPARIGSK